jgi:hypothetical protein
VISIAKCFQVTDDTGILALTGGSCLKTAISFPMVLTCSILFVCMDMFELVEASTAETTELLDKIH